MTEGSCKTAAIGIVTFEIAIAYYKSVTVLTQSTPCTFTEKLGAANLVL